MKRVIVVFLACVLLFSATAFVSDADTGVSVGADRISDEARRNYVNAMLAYHLSESGEKIVSESLKNGKCVLFFFEGASNHALAKSGFSNHAHYRFSAVCIVVRLVEDRPEIVFFDDFCSTIPDNPRAADSRADAVATLLDGVYPVVNCNHFGYAALHVPAYDWGTALRCYRTGHYIDVCYGINIHSRGTDYINVTTNNSAGCLLVGKTVGASSGYNDFMYAVAGISDARNNAFGEVALDYGCVVIDRALYKKELKQIYDTGAGDQNEIVRKLTAYTDGLRVPDPVPDESSEESSAASAEESNAENSAESSAESGAESVEESAGSAAESSAESSAASAEESAGSDAESAATEENGSESKLFVILLAVAGVVVAGIVALVVVMKKKKPATANGASSEDDE